MRYQSLSVLLASTLTACTVMPTATTAAELPTMPYLPLEIARKAADTAMEQCDTDGQKVNVAVVDRNGSTKVLIKIDRALIGGIGVGGASSGDIDEACARAGIEAIGGEQEL